MFAEMDQRQARAMYSQLKRAGAKSRNMTNCQLPLFERVVNDMAA